jgi:adenine phosphoribosyltransferase
VKGLGYASKQVEQLFSSTFICGASKSGKTTHAMNIARTLMRAGVILFIIDSTKYWIDNFKLIKNILTIKNGMLRYETLPTDWENSCILDTSKLSASAHLKFMEKFCSNLMNVAVRESEQNKGKKQRMVIVDECQTSVPAMSLRGAKERGSILQMITQGRHFGIQFMAITQIPSLTDDNLIKFAEHRYFFHLDKKEDINYAKQFVGDLADQLRKLKRGQCVYKYINGATLLTTPRYEEDQPVPTIPIESEELPELDRAIRESPIKEEENKRENSRYFGKKYIFHIYPFGEAGSILQPNLIREIVRRLIEKVNELNVSFDYIVCLGANDKWASHMSVQMNKPVLRIVERETKLPGEKHRHLDTVLYAKDLYFRDFKKGDTVILLDDVVSTGATTEELISILTEMGVKVVGAVFIVAKGDSYRRIEEKLGVPVRFLRYQPLPIVV